MNFFFIWEIGQERGGWGGRKREVLKSEILKLWLGRNLEAFITFVDFNVHCATRWREYSIHDCVRCFISQLHACVAIRSDFEARIALFLVVSSHCTSSCLLK